MTSKRASAAVVRSFRFQCRYCSLRRLAAAIFEPRYSRWSISKTRWRRNGSSQWRFSKPGGKRTTTDAPHSRMVCLGRINADERFPSGE